MIVVVELSITMLSNKKKKSKTDGEDQKAGKENGKDGQVSSNGKTKDRKFSFRKKVKDVMRDMEKNPNDGSSTLLTVCIILGIGHEVDGNEVVGGKWGGGL